MDHHKGFADHPAGQANAAPDPVQMRRTGRPKLSDKSSSGLIILHWTKIWNSGFYPMLYAKKSQQKISG
jgi:hypothetical protein